MDIDELKKQWQSMELRIEKLEEENHRLMSSISSNRVAGLRGRLLTRYCMMIIVCIISPVWLFLLDNVFYVGQVANVCYALFFMITAVANGYVYYLIRKIDLSTMTIKEALTAATNVDIVRRRMKILGWVLAMPLLVILFYAFYEVGRDEIIYGAWVGLVIGAICGGIYERNTRQLIRQMRQTLAEELGEDEEE